MDGVVSRLRELLCFCASELSVDVLDMEIMPDYVHMMMEVDPRIGVHKAVKMMKGRTSSVLRSEFPFLRSRIPTLWTNSYFVSSVGGTSQEDIRWYIDNQKTSQRQKDGLG